jgi:hypothetical protein
MLVVDSNIVPIVEMQVHQVERACHAMDPDPTLFDSASIDQVCADYPEHH